MIILDCLENSVQLYYKLNVKSVTIFGWLVGWLGFYGISTFVGYLMTNPFLCKFISSISNNSVKHEYPV